MCIRDRNSSAEGPEGTPQPEPRGSRPKAAVRPKVRAGANAGRCWAAPRRRASLPAGVGVRAPGWPAGWVSALGRLSPAPRSKPACACRTGARAPHCA
eukprot:1726418-Alexandrium_andersonii.AAC.1